MINSQQFQSISVFFPCYNDKNTIIELVKDADTILKEVVQDYEIVVIDDGSTDGSREILKKAQQNSPRLKLVFHEINKGYGGVLQTGFKVCSKDIIFYTDGDGQYDVKELPLLLDILSSDVDFINGIKMCRNDPAYRVILGNTYNFIARLLFWIPIFDTDCDFRLIKKNICQKINLGCKSGAVCIELVKKAERAGAKFRQIDVHHYKRKYGTSQFFKINRIIPTFVEFVILWISLNIIERIKNKDGNK